MVNELFTLKYVGSYTKGRGKYIFIRKVGDESIGASNES